eukprot:SAG11_NODE_3178_length_2629_cov_5.173123_3_plen_93_part_00
MVTLFTFAPHGCSARFSTVQSGRFEHGERWWEHNHCELAASIGLSAPEGQEIERTQLEGVSNAVSWADAAQVFGKSVVRCRLTLLVFYFVTR